jgi:hypothetical protein
MTAPHHLSPFLQLCPPSVPLCSPPTSPIHTTTMMFISPTLPWPLLITYPPFYSSAHPRLPYTRRRRHSSPPHHHGHSSSPITLSTALPYLSTPPQPLHISYSCVNGSISLHHITTATPHALYPFLQPCPILAPVHGPPTSPVHASMMGFISTILLRISHPLSSFRWSHQYSPYPPSLYAFISRGDSSLRLPIFIYGTQSCTPTEMHHSWAFMPYKLCPISAPHLPHLAPHSSLLHNFPSLQLHLHLVQMRHSCLLPGTL